MGTVEEAAAFAAGVHGDGRRKGTDRPYVEHLAAVARLAAEHGGGRDVVAAAWLHDAVEDAGVSLETIGERFGPRVAALVETATEPDRSAPWERRKGDALARLETADREAALLKAADALANVRDTLADVRREGAEAWQRFNRGRARQLWWHLSLARLVEQRLPGDAIAQTLRRTVDELCLASLRRAGEADVEHVLDLTERLYDPPAARPADYDRAAARRRALWWTGHDDRLLLLADPDAGGPPVGYVAAAMDVESIRFGRRCWVEDLITEPGARGQGHGAALLAAARAWARGRGGTHLGLSTGRARQDAQRFYAREGGLQSSLVYAWRW